jgi:hypothetical protein
MSVIGYDVMWKPGTYDYKGCDHRSDCQRPSPCYTNQRNGKYTTGLSRNHVDCLNLSNIPCELKTIKPSGVRWNAASSIYENGRDNNVPQDCEYNVTDFKTFESVKEFFDKFIRNRSNKRFGQYNKALAMEQFDKIMVYFMSTQLATNCTDDPITGMSRTSCSYRFTTNAEILQFVTNWWTTTKPENRDMIATNFCNLHENMTECACKKRGQNKIYQALKRGNPISDCCWWMPCSNPDQFFVDSKDQGAQCGKGCPKSICENIIAAYEGSTLNINDVKNYISCGNIPSKGGDDNTRPLWQKILFFVLPITIFVVILLIYEFPKVKEFIRVYHVAVGLGMLIIFTIGGILYFFRNQL